MKTELSIVPLWSCLIMANDYAIAGNMTGWMVFIGIGLGLFAWRFISAMRGRGEERP